MHINDCYKLLGLSPDAGPQELREAHRRLVKEWHPDRFAHDPQKQKEAEKKFKEINKAYHHARNFAGIRHATRKASSGGQGSQYRNKSGASSSRSNTGYTSQTNYQRRQKSQSRKQTTNSAPNPKTRESRKKARPGKQEFRRNWLDDKLNRINRYFQLKHLANRRKRNESKIEKELRQAEKIYERKREDMENRTRVGMYRSWFNQLVFRILARFKGGDSLKQGLGSYNPSQKYEVEVRHRLIQDQIFYAINNHFNLFLKYLVGFYLGFRFLYNVSASFYMGYMIASPSTFIASQLILLGIMTLLFLPDSLYQRIVLWKYRSISMRQIHEYFAGRKLPSPWNFWKNIIITGKYVVVISSILLIYH